MENKIKEVIKYLTDRYYIWGYEERAVFHAFDNWIYIGDKVLFLIIWNAHKGSIELERKEKEFDILKIKKFDILKIKSIIKGTEIILKVDDKIIDHD